MYFYISEIDKGIVEGANANHMLSMRVKEGEKYPVTDVMGTRAIVKIEEVNRRTKIVKYQIIEETTQETPSQERILIQAKIDKFYLEKMCEITALADISKIIIFESDRSQKQNVNYGRLERIMIRCCEQGEKIFKPSIYFLKTEGELVEILDKLKPTVLSLDPETGKSEEPKQKSNSIIVGPEGGWSEEEMIIFKEHKLPFTSLGDTVFPAWIAGYSYFI